MNLAKILKSLSRTEKRSSAELRSELEEIDLQELERKVTDVERRRRGLLIHGSDEDVAEATRELTLANTTAERGQVAVEELQKMIAEAEKRERNQQIETLGAAAHSQAAELARQYVEADHLGERAAQLLTAIEVGRRELLETNKRLKEAGRADLCGAWPEHVLAEIVGADANPLSFPRPLEWQLHGHWPPRVTVKPERRYCRLAELQPARRQAA